MTLFSARKHSPQNGFPKVCTLCFTSGTKSDFASNGQVALIIILTGRTKNIVNKLSYFTDNNSFPEHLKTLLSVTDTFYSIVLV